VTRIRTPTTFVFFASDPFDFDSLFTLIES
jgi:hypothetical protein